jgi:hypothetical protein
MDVTNNPSRRSSTVTPKRRLSILVICVVKEFHEASQECIQNIKKYTLEKDCMFETREYQPSTYRYDRDEIERLPAFHIEVSSIWQKTFYPNGRPYQIIESAITDYLKRIEILQKQQHKKKSFRTVLSSILAYIRKLGHRKTRMEKFQEQEDYEKQAYERKRTESFRERMQSISISEWN